MATVVGHKINNINIGHLQQNQLTRSLERILEDAHLSGELKLSGRKLKDFPKCAGKYNLNDTVIADLSRNRFCELPEELTGFPFLETLLVYHNALRSIPESIKGLYSLSYLDLRSNQLATLPREICLLPLQVLLISNNRLSALPDELGRMDSLTELDAACNQITHLPPRMSDLRNLKSLSLRSNQLVYLPREIKYLNLVFLDISSNRIAALPIELRLMTTLVNLELNNNPLTSPPASLCVRGLVHVFKYLETLAAKEEKNKTGGNYDGHATLRRTITTPKQTLIENDKARKSNPELCDRQDKNWSAEILHDQHSNQMVQSNSSSLTGSPINARAYDNSSSDRDSRSITPTNQPRHFSIERQVNSSDSSPEYDLNSDNHRIDDKFKLLGNVQTYREYKEALRQQRNQDSSSIYRPKDQSAPINGNTPSPQYSQDKSQTLSPTTIFNSGNNSNQNSPTLQQNKPLSPEILPNQNGHSSFNVNSENIGKTDDILTTPTNSNKKPVQKVTPSRNTNVMYNNKNPTVQLNPVTNINGNNTTTNEYDGYVKPKSPTNIGGNIYANTMPASTQSMNKISTGKIVPKPNRSVSWNRDIPADKLSFTMRREFDKQKEETELIEQLRNIIDNRLKMSLPTDIASALSDGVVLCHLANHVRPRSVGSIHVPSAAVPKLTMAKCRRNVDNFLNACRSIGVDEELICSCADIVPSTSGDQPDNSSDHLPNLMALYQTIAALDVLLIKQQQMQVVQQHHENTATNTKTVLQTNSNAMTVPDATININKYSLDDISLNNSTTNNEHYDNNIINEMELNGNYTWTKDDESLDIRQVPNTLNLTSSSSIKRKLPQVKRNVLQKNSKFELFFLNGIIEENENDECRKVNNDHLNGSKENVLNGTEHNMVNGNFNNGFDCDREKIADSKTGIYKKNEDFLKLIEYFDTNKGQNLNKNGINQNVGSENKQLSTVLCLGTFLITLILLIIFEIPS